MSLDYKVFFGLCPDGSCQTKIYFPAHKLIIECPNCGQHHSQGSLCNIDEVTDAKEALTEVLKSIAWDAKMPKKGSDLVKVHGLSNYHCKLLSPLFTRYGMDKEGNPKLLSDLGHGETADCGRLLSHRAFLIAPEHVGIIGYGLDRSGSTEYLKGILDIIRGYHDGEERIVPVHADGDGHCLVHALSRATTGREIFWHALRDNLVHHLEKNLKTYKNLFRDFIDQDDWRIIIDEADPYHISPEGFNVGLGNIHIFALANVLKRPIVLLDSLEGMKNVADYTAIFVPALVEPSQCHGNLPLCIAWSGSGHNHFIPLVGVAGKPLPAIPQPLVPNIWGIDRAQGQRYLNFNTDGSLTVAGGKPLQQGYLLRLVSAMERVFLKEHSVAAKLVADMHLYVYRQVGFAGLHPDVAIEETREAVNNSKIFRCLLCGALSLANVDERSLQPGGYLYKIMRDSHGKPRGDVTYNFPTEGLQCRYDSTNSRLVPHQFPCRWCGLKRLRKVDRLGNTMYENADATTTPAEIKGQCCGFKHFWDGREYENIPKQFLLNITLQGRTIEEKVTWFYGDVDPSLNSDGHKIAKDIAVKHFGPDDAKLSRLMNKILIAVRSRLREFCLTEEEFDDDASRGVNVGHSDWKHDQHPNTPSKLCKTTVEADRPSTSKHFSTKEMSKCIQQQPPPEDNPKLNLKSKSSVASSLNSGSDVRVRVSTSDGRQDTVVVDNDLDYVGLQNTVLKHFGIPPARQVLKLGFPPKPIEVTHGKKPLGLRSGDRVTVEVKAEKKTSETKKTAEKGPLLKKGIHSSVKDDPYNNFHDFIDLLNAARTKTPERSMPSSNAVDAALSAVKEMAEFTGRTEWEYAVQHPELFRPGGAFYNQFERDIGLTHGRHCTLPLLQGRVFRYNNDTDQVELCLEPTGHFPIGPDVVGIIDSSNRRRSENSIGQVANDEKLEENQESSEVVTEMEVENMAEDGVTGALVEDAEPMNVSEDVCGTVERSPLEDPTLEDKQSRNKISENSPSKKSKLAPGFTTLGLEAATVSPGEAEERRLALMKVLQSKKQSNK